MDSSFLHAFNLFVLAIILLRFPVIVHGSGVFRVKSKFGAGTPVADLIRHDELRHARRLSSPVDVHIGGNMEMIQMWYADIAIGTPPRHFQLRIDTGSDEAWVDCEGYSSSQPKVKMETYNPKLSKTARIVTDDESLCDELHWNKAHNSSKGLCDFKVKYEDGTHVTGYYVIDLVSFDQVSSNPTTNRANVTFGCITRKTGFIDAQSSAVGFEGIMGFSWTKNSVLSQMAASTGRLRKEFAHCLDKEGGIFAVGHVVKPKVTTMTPLFEDGDYCNYFVSVTSIEVGGHSHTHQYKVLVDTGCTFNVLPKATLDFVMEKVFINHPNLKKKIDPSTPEFQFSGSVDAEFPIINFHVNMSHALKLYPHDYMVPINEEKTAWIFAFRTIDDNEFVIGLVSLRNKLFIYDLENKQLGWQDYNCSSSIELEDEDGVCNIGAHNVNSQPN